MKSKLFLIATTLLVSLSSFSQDIASLKTDAEKMYQSTVNIEIDNILDSTYPKIYDFVTREQLKEVLLATFKGNDEMKVKLLSVEPNFKFGEIVKIDDQTFCLIKYNLSMELTIIKQIQDDETELITDVFKSAMETDDVTYTKETNSFVINKVSTLIAISDTATQNKWKFLNHDKKNVLVEKLFSKKIIKKLGL